MRSNLDVARLLLRRAGSDMAEFNPFAVTIRYDDVDEAVSLALAKEMFDKCTQVLAVVVAALPEEIRP